jgi:hypothetical protein
MIARTPSGVLQIVARMVAGKRKAPESSLKCVDTSNYGYSSHTN